MLNHYRKNMRAAVGSSAGPYGYTLATWTTGAVLTNTRGIPDTLAALAFMVGPCWVSPSSACSPSAA